MKKRSVANLNFILILPIIIVMIYLAFSNQSMLEKGELLLTKFDVETWGLDLLHVIFVWVPLIHAVFLFLFAGIAWAIFKPTPNGIIVYRVLMTFAYLNIVVTIIASIVGIIVHFSVFQEFKIFVFIVLCAGILVFNAYMTYSPKIKENILGNRFCGYDRNNLVPVVRASICTGEKVAGFKDLHTGKFQEIMLVKNEKDMQKFLTKYNIAAEDIKKEW